MTLTEFKLQGQGGIRSTAEIFDPHPEVVTSKLRNFTYSARVQEYSVKNWGKGSLMSKFIIRSGLSAALLAGSFGLAEAQTGGGTGGGGGGGTTTAPVTTTTAPVAPTTTKAPAPTITAPVTTTTTRATTTTAPAITTTTTAPKDKDCPPGQAKKGKDSKNSKCE